MQRHWLVTLQDLAATGRQWDTDMPKALLADSDVGSVQPVPDLVTDVHWKVSLQRKGDVYLLTGDWQGKIKRQCSRCNAEFDCPIEGPSEWEFQLGEAPHVNAAEAECESTCEYIAAPGRINMVDVLREDIWLAWKADVICSDSCKGLCQGCGINLNRETCQCEQDKSDHPFAALRGLKLDG